MRQIDALKARRQAALDAGDAAMAAALAAELRPLRERLRLIPFAFDRT
jgi:hypothetical protein